MIGCRSELYTSVLCELGSRKTSRCPAKAPLPTYRRRSVCRKRRPHKLHTCVGRRATWTTSRWQRWPTPPTQSRRVPTTVHHRATVERQNTASHSALRPGNAVEKTRRQGTVLVRPHRQAAAVDRAASSRWSTAAGPDRRGRRERLERRQSRSPTED